MRTRKITDAEKNFAAIASHANRAGNSNNKPDELNGLNAKNKARLRELYADEMVIRSDGESSVRLRALNSLLKELEEEAGKLDGKKAQKVWNQYALVDKEITRLNDNDQKGNISSVAANAVNTTGVLKLMQERSVDFSHHPSLRAINDGDYKLAVRRIKGINDCDASELESPDNKEYLRLAIADLASDKKTASDAVELYSALLRKRIILDDDSPKFTIGLASDLCRIDSVSSGKVIVEAIDGGLEIPSEAIVGVGNKIISDHRTPGLDMIKVLGRIAVTAMKRELLSSSDEESVMFISDVIDVLTPLNVSNETDEDARNRKRHAFMISDFALDQGFVFCGVSKFDFVIESFNSRPSYDHGSVKLSLKLSDNSNYQVDFRTKIGALRSAAAGKVKFDDQPSIYSGYTNLCVEEINMNADKKTRIWRAQVLDFINYMTSVGMHGQAMQLATVALENDYPMTDTHMKRIHASVKANKGQIREQFPHLRSLTLRPALYEFNQLILEKAKAA